MKSAAEKEKSGTGGGWAEFAEIDVKKAPRRFGKRGGEREERNGRRLQAA